MSAPGVAGRLEVGLNGWTVRDLPEWSVGPSGSARERLETLAEAGYRHLQLEDHDPLLGQARAMRFELAGAARVLVPDQAEAIAERHAGEGLVLTTLHLGAGLERQAEAFRLVEGVLEASLRHRYPLHVETHRATITQDPLRTLELVEAFPELTLNADLSHWYTGVEMVYGDWQAKLDALAPIFARVRYIQGRIGDSGAMQVALDPAAKRPCQAHFAELWRRCFEGFLAYADTSEKIVFCAELLPNRTMLDGVAVELNYARLLTRSDGTKAEESDRWLQAELLNLMAREAYEEALRAGAPCV